MIDNIIDEEIGFKPRHDYLNETTIFCHTKVSECKCIEQRSVYMNETGSYNAEKVSIADNWEKIIEEVSIMPSRTIAGYESDCFDVQTKSNYYEMCYSSEGIPTYFKPLHEKDSYEKSIIATKITEGIPLDTFELPSPMIPYTT